MFISYIFYFALYSVLGWVYETVLCSVEAGHTVNRGFLNGPYCPIYGFGSIVFLILLGRESSPFLIFLFGALIACAIEYATSLVIEKLFAARLWDYSKFKFNLHGRICLGAAAVFGAFAVLLIKFIHPFTVKLAEGIPRVIFIALTAAVLVTFILDFFITVKGFSGFNVKLKGHSDKSGLTPDLSGQQKRLLRAFPTMRSLRYGEELNEMRGTLKKREK